MNSKEIDVAKNKYADLFLQKQNYEQAIIKIEILKKDPIIREYLELVNYIKLNENRFDKNRMLSESFDELAKNTKANQNIYVYMGRYLFNVKDGKLSKETGGFPWDTKEYRNIETMEAKYVSYSKSEQFEKDNKVIYLGIKDNDNLNSYESCYNKFLEIRNLYFQFLLENSEENAVQKILSLNTTNK